MNYRDEFLIQMNEERNKTKIYQHSEKEIKEKNVSVNTNTHMGEQNAPNTIKYILFYKKIQIYICMCIWIRHTTKKGKFY